MGTHKRWLAAGIVAVSLMPALWMLASNRDIPMFGFYQDDGLFLIGAKSLSQQGSFRILSLPGEPFQTKYAPLHSALLSLIWSADSSFPGNLELVSIYQGLVFVAMIGMCGLLFREFRFSPLESAGLCAFLALSPWTIYWATVPVSDYLFTALMAAAFVALHRSAGAPGKAWLAGAALLTSAAFLTKSAGLLIVPAAALGMGLRRAWGRLGLYLAMVTPPAAGWLLWTASHRVVTSEPILWYYTDYLGAFFKTGGVAALPEIIPSNLLSMMATVGEAVIHDLSDSLPGRFLSILLLVASVTGAFRIRKRAGRSEYPVFCGLLAATLLIWNYSPNARLMLPLMPLAAMGMYLEGVKFARLLRGAFAGPDRGNRAAAYVIAAGAAACCIYGVSWNARFLFTGMPAMLEAGRQRNLESRKVLDWCRDELPASSVLLAANDSMVYLYTGLKSVRPVPNSVAFYTGDREDMLANFTGFDDVQRGFGITHVLLGPDMDLSSYSREDREYISRLLRSKLPPHPLYSAGGFELYEVQPRERASASR